MRVLQYSCQFTFGFPKLPRISQRARAAALAAVDRRGFEPERFCDGQAGRVLRDKRPSLSLVMDLVFSPLVHGFPTSQHSIWATVGLSTESVGSPRPHARAHTVCACGWVVSCREPHSLLR